MLTRHGIGGCRTMGKQAEACGGARDSDVSMRNARQAHTGSLSRG